MNASRLKKLEMKAGISNAQPKALLFTTVYENRDGSVGQTYITAYICGETPEQCYSINNEEGEDREEFEKRVKVRLSAI